ncbi:MAG: indole-3-glycerol phosphate synthase TrpC [Calditrichia bacterium]
MAATILDKILKFKRDEVAAARKSMSLSQLQEAISQAPETRSLKAALSGDELAIIAELKKASPSAGVIREPFVVEELAASYLNYSATALSVLTDSHFFQGSLKYLKRLRKMSDVPLLRKDFIIDSYQVYEARANHADAILLIVAALEESELRELMGLCYSLNMEALVEVHSEEEADVALRCNAPIIGVNNRDLATFSIDLATTERLAELLPKSTCLVAESGLATGMDGVRMQQAGAQAVLIGSHFMRHANPGLALKQFRAEMQTCR